MWILWCLTPQLNSSHSFCLQGSTYSSPVHSSSLTSSIKEKKTHNHRIHHTYPPTNRIHHTTSGISTPVKFSWNWATSQFFQEIYEQVYTTYIINFLSSVKLVNNKKPIEQELELSFSTLSPKQTKKNQPNKQKKHQQSTNNSNAFSASSLLNNIFLGALPLLHQYYSY